MNNLQIHDDSYSWIDVENLKMLGQVEIENVRVGTKWYLKSIRGDLIETLYKTKKGSLVMHRDVDGPKLGNRKPWEQINTLTAIGWLLEHNIAIPDCLKKQYERYQL